jgi:predicted amidohydrolase YtcJ
VAPLNPLEGLYAAVTRRTLDGATPDGWVPAQKITIEEALRAYTTANAYAGFQDERLGTLEAGKYADFVVLSENLFEIDPVAIPNVQVLRTVIGGQERYVAAR